MGSFLDLVPDVLKGESPAEQRIAQGFDQKGSIGGLINTVSEVPSLASDVGSEAAQYTTAGPVLGALRGLSTGDLKGAAIGVGLLGLGAAGALRGYHNYRAGLLDNSEIGAVMFPGGPDLNVAAGPRLPPAAGELPVYARPEYRPTVSRDILRAQDHAAVAGIVGRFPDTVAGQVRQRALAGYSQALGDQLVQGGGIHTEVAQQYRTPEAASVAAASWEMAKLQAAFDRNLLMPGDQPELADIYQRLVKTPEKVTDVERQALLNFQVDFATKTQDWLTPDLYVPPPLRLVGIEPRSTGTVVHAEYDSNLLPVRVDKHGFQMRVNALRYNDLLPMMVHNTLTLPHDQAYMNWYRDANGYAQQLAARYKISVEKAAAILAAFSPRTDWDVNKEVADKFLASGGTLSYFKGVLAAEREKALAGEQGGNFKLARKVYDSDTPLEMLQALKTHNFEHNILDPEDPRYSTHDSHDFDAKLGFASRLLKPGLFDQNPKGRAIYAAIQEANSTAAGIEGVLPGEHQAMVWGPIREAKNAAPGQRILLAPDDQIFRIVHGQGDPPIAQLVKNAASGPVVSLDPPVEHDGVLVTLGDEAGIAVHGKATSDVRDSFRGLRPIIGDEPGAVRWAPVAPRRVEDESMLRSRLVEAPPEGLAPFSSTSVHSGTSSNLAPMVPGNHLWVEAAGTDPSELVAKLKAVGLDAQPYEPFQRFEPDQAPTRLKLEDLDEKTFATAASPLKANQWVQWVGVSGFQDEAQTGLEGRKLGRFNEGNHKRLGAELKKKGYHPIESRGNYGGHEEKSWIVFGMPNSEAIALGRSYGQESVVSPLGYMYTTGDKAGQMHPAAGEVTFKRARTNFAHLPIGKKGVQFQQPIDFGTLQPIPSDIDASLRADAGKSRSAVTVPLGDTVTPDAVAAAWNAANLDGVSRALYLQGGISAPAGAAPMWEHVHVDSAGRTIIHRGLDSHADAVNGVPVYVPAEDALRYTSQRNRALVDTRLKGEANTYQPAPNGLDFTSDGELQALVSHLPGKLMVSPGNILNASVEGHGRPKVAAVSVDPVGPRQLPALAYGTTPEEAFNALVALGARGDQVAFVDIAGPQANPRVSVRPPTTPAGPDVGKAVEAIRLLRRAGVQVKDVRSAIKTAAQEA